MVCNCIKTITNGCFNQTRPLGFLRGSKECFSFDLSAATDRWPLVTLFETFQALFDRSFASATVNSALEKNIFLVPFVKRKWSQVSFVAGQPVGYYASWPLFAFTHHLMIWWAAEKKRCTQVIALQSMRYLVMMF
jgi:hypothetical protein